MATEVQTHRGRCATHGDVEATRAMPRMGFPFLVFAIRRAMAKKRPYLCPECGNPVDES
jgi:hypothetical protein